KIAFVDFLKSISWVDRPGVASRKPHFASTNDKRIPSGQSQLADGPDSAIEPGKPSWEVPAGWQEVAASQMLLAKFLVGGNEGRAEVTVSAFPGDTGSVLGNVNRWRAQVGLAPLSQEDADRQ